MNLTSIHTQHFRHTHTNTTWSRPHLCDSALKAQEKCDSEEAEGGKEKSEWSSCTVKVKVHSETGEAGREHRHLYITTSWFCEENKHWKTCERTSGPIHYFLFSLKRDETVSSVKSLYARNIWQKIYFFYLNATTFKSLSIDLHCEWHHLLMVRTVLYSLQVCEKVTGWTYSAHTKQVEPLWKVRVQHRENTYWSGSVSPEESSSGRHHCGSKFPFPPLELDVSSAHNHRYWLRSLASLLFTQSPTLPPCLDSLWKIENDQTLTCKSDFKQIWKQSPQSLKRDQIINQYYTFLDSSSWWRPTTTSSPRPDRKTYMKILTNKRKWWAKEK